jgi:hypothetical protein
MSLDSVAIDSVGFDFLTSEWPDLPDIANADNYLRESALANNPPSKTVHVLNATASDAAASVYMSIGIMGRTRSTRAISEKRTGLNFSKSEVQNMLELPLIGGFAQLQKGHRYSGRQDDPESVFLMLRSDIHASGNCVFPIILEPV